MENCTDIRDHLNVFNILTTHVSGMETKIEEDDKTYLLLTMISPSYDNLVITLSVGKETKS